MISFHGFCGCCSDKSAETPRICRNIWSVRPYFLTCFPQRWVCKFSVVSNEHTGGTSMENYSDQCHASVLNSMYTMKVLHVTVAFYAYRTNAVELIDYISIANCKVKVSIATQWTFDASSGEAYAQHITWLQPTWCTTHIFE